MSLLDIAPIEKKGGAGGGLLGSILGGLAAAAATVAAIPSGGATLAAVPAAYGLGSTVGGMAGAEIDPATNPRLSSQIGHSDVNPMKHLESHPEMMMLKLSDAKDALQSSDLSVPEYNQYYEHISQAQDALRKRLGVA